MASTASPPASTAASAKPVITPDHSLDHRMHVDKKIVDEILLVCGVLGSTDEATGNFVPVEDCLNWLQDLQRALRRDDDLYRPISLLLGQWKVVEQKLLPLVLSCRYDTAMVLTICKILVILTKPLAENTARAGKMVIDVKKKNEKRVVDAKIKLRENALQQAETLMNYKKAFLHFKEKDGEGPLSVFVSLLAEPLSKQGNSRTDADHLTIELVLHLFRNLLAAEPLLFASADAVHRSHELRANFLCLLEKELVLDIMLVLGANLDQRENAQYNLLLMELLHHVLRNQDATAIANSSKNKGMKPKAGLLKSQLQREKLTGVPIGARHSNFGGTLQLKSKGDRPRQYVSTAALLGGTAQAVAATKSSGKATKKSDPFLPCTTSSSAHSRRSPPVSPAAQRAQEVLHRFGPRFVSECYGPILKSLKNEFRRDSVRLEGGDRCVFFSIMHFWIQWWRNGGRKLIPEMGQLIFGMDLFTFQLVLNSIDHFQQHKKHGSLAQTTALLSEMMHLLYEMYQSKESTEQLMALGLLDRLFYAPEPLDRLPKLLSQWSPGVGTREFLCDVAEVCHYTMKLLDAQAVACKEYATGMPKAKRKSKSEKDPQDTVAKLKSAAADFDVQGYWARKIVSNHTVYMYTQLLSQYAINAPQVNHRVVTFFMRLAKVKVVVPEEPDPDMPQNPLATKKVTLEPMLFNVRLMMVLNTILNDKTIAKDSDYTTTLSFAASTVYKFAQMAAENQLLYVEALLPHPIPHRFCELLTNHYVNEELRLLADRELLLEGQAQLEEQVAAAENDNDDDEDDSEDEVEFEDFGLLGKTSSGKDTSDHSSESAKLKKKKSIEDSEDEEEDAVEKSTEDNNDVAPDHVSDKPSASDCTNEKVNSAKKRSIVDSEDEEQELVFDEAPQTKRLRSIDDSDDE